MQIVIAWRGALFILPPGCPYLNRQELKMSEWISVKDNIPKNGQRVKVKTFDKDDKEIEIEAIFSIYDIGENMVAWGWNIGKIADTIARPTHWMPMPKPPDQLNDFTPYPGG